MMQEMKQGGHRRRSDRLEMCPESQEKGGCQQLLTAGGLSWRALSEAWRERKYVLLSRCFLFSPLSFHSSPMLLLFSFKL